jgi:hypothetical protein
MRSRFAGGRSAIAGLSVAMAFAWVPRAQAAGPAPDALAEAPPPPPGADQIQFAAREHDLGYRAYLDKQYDEAASHFENAFFAAPNPAELRSAIRSRRDAGELARAATLAAIALRRYPSDAATSKVASDTIAQARAHVYEVELSSSAEYSVAIDAKIVSAERATESRVFMNAGAHELLVSWSDDRNERIPIQATEGGSQTLHLDPPQSPAPTPPPPPVPPPPVPPPPLPTAAAVVAPPPAAKPFGPAVFITGAALTAVALGVTVWSGINTENDPGKDAVKADCVGKGTPCATYQAGLAHETRTDVLIGVTSGLAVASAIVGVFFTEWSATSPASSASPASPSRPAGAAGRAGGGARVTPVIGFGEAGIAGSF